MSSSIDQEISPPQEISLTDGDCVQAFQVDDMVWGKVKSHPWWPGQIFNESFAGPTVRKTRHVEGRKPDAVLVAFFGDSSYGWFDPSELIHFDPNFREMSSQANFKSFVNAVSEATDEASRRGALSVVCKCRNDSNFEPAGKENYVYVDLPGLGEKAMYSLKQIDKARELFDPVKALQFVKDMAVGSLNVPESYGDDMVLFMKMRAMMQGYRYKVFEESDKTYEEAFCADVGPGAQIKQERIVQRGISQRAELFSGELKIAETLSSSDKKLKRLPSSSSSSSFSQPPNKKQKRLASSTKTTKPKPEAKPASQSQQKSRFKSTPSKRVQKDSDKYVLKRRDDAGPTPSSASSLPDLPCPPPVPDQQDVSVLVSPEDDKFVLQRREANKGEAEEEEPIMPVLVKLKSQKRKKTQAQASTIVVEGEAQLEKKKKKKNKKKIELDNLDTAQVVFDMQQLAVNPLHGKDQGAADSVSHMILKFRSMVYQKSLLNNKQTVKKENSDVSKVTPSKPMKQALKKKDVAGSSVAGPKRGPSDRQEELGMKKQKKIDKIKALASEKKTALTKVVPKEVKEQKPELPPAPRIPCATALMMKFPIKTALPSIATLKAKLARFGPIDLSNTRVYWNSHMCKVTFKFNEDAKAALNYVNTNEIFGQSKVQYYIREVELPQGQDPVPESGPQRSVSGTQRAVSGPQRADSRVKFRPEPSESGPSIDVRPKLPIMGQPPKSILKKPGEEIGAVASASNGPRVKFMIDRSISGPSKTETIVGGSANNKPLAFSQPSILPRPPLAHPARPSIDTRQFPPPPPLASRPVSSAWAAEETRDQMMGLVHDGPVRAREERMEVEVDISGQFYGLLMQCNDIVTRVKNSLGYLPYHHL